MFRVAAEAWARVLIDVWDKPKGLVVIVAVEAQPKVLTTAYWM